MESIYLCDCIEYIAKEKVQSVENGTALLNDGESFVKIKKVSNGTFTQEGKQTNGGLLVSQKLEVVMSAKLNDIDLLSMAALIFRLHFSDGRTVIWGTPEVPVMPDTGKQGVAPMTLNFTRNNIVYEF